jgi:hypothetical protein
MGIAATSDKLAAQVQKKHPMKRKKRILLFAAGLWAFLSFASVYSVYLARGTPSWYVNNPLTDAQRQTAANDADQKLADLLSYANDIAANQRRHQLGQPLTDIAAKTITLTELEANEFVAKWQGLVGNSIKSRFTKYMTDCRLVLLDNRLVIAGTLRDASYLTDSVISITFAPRLDDRGYLWTTLEQVYSGRLLVPRVFTSKLETRFRALLRYDQSRWHARAQIGPDGLANRAAVDLLWTRLVLSSLDNQPDDTLLFLPLELADPKHAVPVRLVDLRMSDGSMTFTIRPLADQELHSLQTGF